MNFTGNDLRALRKGLSLSADSLAKHLGFTPKFIRKAERHNDETIPLDGEFRVLFDKLLYAAPRMIMIRFEYMQNVQKVLQGVSLKLERIDKWFQSEARRESGEEPEVEEEEEDYEADDRRILKSGGVDKRTTFLMDDDD
jgi:transcriptional regulator with XRE-family HTH domain